MKAIDWSKIYKKYKGQWVALARDEVTVAGRGRTLKEALVRAHKRGYANPLVTHMPKRIIPCVPAFCAT